jgi:hypothetical protein
MMVMESPYASQKVGANCCTCRNVVVLRLSGCHRSGSRLSTACAEWFGRIEFNCHIDADAHRNLDSSCRNSYSDTDRYGRFEPGNRHSYSNEYGTIDRYTYRYLDRSFRSADWDSDDYIYIDAHRGQYARRDRDGNRNINGDRDANRDRHAHIDGNEYADANSYIDSYIDAEPHANFDEYINFDQYADSDRHGNQHANTNTDRNIHSGRRGSGSAFGQLILVHR